MILGVNYLTATISISTAYKGALKASTEHLTIGASSILSTYAISTINTVDQLVESEGN